jgi:carbamoyl-phosphate synthase large subunit
VNILITSASRKVSLVRAFQKALAAEGGGTVYAMDASPQAAALYFADQGQLGPCSDCPEFLPFMLRFCEAERIELLVPTRDEELPLFAAHREQFAGIGTYVMVSDPETIRTCQDKWLFLEFCAAHGFRTPRTFRCPGTDRPERFPVFIKPRVGKGGSRAARLDSAEEMMRALAEMPDAIVQEYVRATEYTVDVFADRTGEVISAVPRERVSVFGGESFVSRTTKPASSSSNSTLVMEGQPTWASRRERLPRCF